MRVALVEQWSAFAWAQARKWHLRNGRGELEDYRSAAQVGLWDAAVRFDPTKGVQFGTFAGWYLLKHLRPHAHRDAAGGFHVPDSHGFVRLDPLAFGAAGGEDDRDYAGTIPDHRAADPREEPPDAGDVWAAVARVLAGRPREIAVLEAIYRDGLTLRQAGERIGGVSRERVRQIEVRALGRLRDKGSRFAGFLGLEGAA